MQQSPEQQENPLAPPDQPASLPQQTNYPAVPPVPAALQGAGYPSQPSEQQPTIPLSSASTALPTQPLRPSISQGESQPVYQPGENPMPSAPAPQAPSVQQVNWFSFSHLIGHPLIDVTEGRKIGEVRDLLLDEQRRFIRAFSTKGGFLHGPTYVPALKATIGVDAVTFQPGALGEQDTSWLDTLPKASRIIGMRVLTDTGKLIGTVDDLRLDPHNGTLLALELKPEHAGILHRLGSGRRLMPATGVISYGPDTIVAQENALASA